MPVTSTNEVVMEISAYFTFDLIASTLKCWTRLILMQRLSFLSQQHKPLTEDDYPTKNTAQHKNTPSLIFFFAQT